MGMAQLVPDTRPVCGTSHHEHSNLVYCRHIGGWYDPSFRWVWVTYPRDDTSGRTNVVGPARMCPYLEGVAA